jgi:hypothetical protein
MLDGLKRNDIREKQTGRNIFEHLRDLNHLHDNKKVILERHLIATAEDLRQELRRFERDFSEDFSYILHLECHGGDAGIELGDSLDAVAWNELRDLLGTLNMKNGCNVGLVLACCNGFGSLKIENFADPAPCYFHLSHRGKISAGVLEDSLIGFYNSILNDHDLTLAIKAAKPFEMKYAEQIFLDLMYRIIHREPRVKFINEQVETILSGVLAQGGLAGNRDVAYNRKLVKSRFGTFEQLIAHFLQTHLSFFCGREPAFDLQQVTKWIANGKTLV